MTDTAAEAKSFKSLFNAKSMLLKVGRDAAIATGFTAWAMHTQNYAHSTDALAWALMVIPTTLATTFGRYAGGGIGLAIDKGLNSIKEQPLYTRPYARKVAAALGGAAAGTVMYAFGTFITGIVPLHVVEVGPETQAPVVQVAQNVLPQKKLG